MNKKYKILFGVSLFIITFLINMNVTLAVDFKYGAKLENIEGSNGEYVYTCNDIKVNFSVLDVGNNNTSDEDNTCTQKQIDAGICDPEDEENLVSGRLLDESESRSLKKETIKFNKNGSYVTTYIAQAGPKQTNSLITIQITPEVSNGESVTVGVCEPGRINIKYKEGLLNKIDQANSKIKFKVQIENPKMQNGDFDIRFNTVFSRGSKEGSSSGSYGASFSFDIAQKVQDTIDSGGDLGTLYEDESANLGEHISEDEAAENYFIPVRTSVNGNFAKESQELTCDNSLEGFINDIWKYFVIFGPVLLIIMSVLDFFKAIFSFEQDMVSKAASNTVKRTLATIILLMLPLLLRTILSFFGLELCL